MVPKAYLEPYFDEYRRLLISDDVIETIGRFSDAGINDRLRPIGTGRGGRGSVPETWHAWLESIRPSSLPDRF
jgi:hypothetical protein